MAGADIRKKIILAIIVIAAIGVAVFSISNGTGIFAEGLGSNQDGELSTGGRGSEIIINKVEVIKVVSDDSVIVKKLPRVYADGKAYESKERNEYELATGDEFLAVFHDPYMEESLARLKNIKDGDTVTISYWGDTKIDYSRTPWTVECEALEIGVEPM